jgi:two-component system, OmpR family, sensor kinase
VTAGAPSRPTAGRDTAGRGPARGASLARFARLPIRIRLTIAFAAAMAAVLAAAGVITFEQFEGDLDGEIDTALKAQAADIAALVGAGRSPEVVASSRERLAQIYAPDGRVVASTPAAASLRLLTRAQVRRAARAPLRVARLRLPGGDARVRALPARHPSGKTATVAVGDFLERRDHAVGRLRTLLLVAGPLALLLASVAGYELAGAALRPVDRMRARAELINEGRLSERLPVPEVSDEVGALGRTLNALLDRIEATVARERRLVSDASHELRTPLTTLRAEVDLALRGNRDPAELRAALESAAEEAKRMTRLADDLLVLARADQGRLPIKAEPLAARDLILAAVARAGAAADAKGRAILAHTESTGDATVLADPDRTAQALDNLVGNSLRYGDGTIALTARAQGELVELHVTDVGGGFPDDLIDRAFERFGRGDEARASGAGSGLGLAIVDAIARAHGGEAGVGNRPEGGADAWIALPRG